MSFRRKCVWVLVLIYHLAAPGNAMPQEPQGNEKLAEELWLELLARSEIGRKTVATGMPDRMIFGKPADSSDAEFFRNPRFRGMSFEEVRRQYELEKSVILGVHGDRRPFDDNRTEISQVLNDFIMNNGRSVVALFLKSQVSKWDDSSWRLTTRNYDSKYWPRRCNGEKFADQQTGAFCTGFLVSADLIVTARHCVFDEVDKKPLSMADVIFVVDWETDLQGLMVNFVPGDRVFNGCAVVTQAEEGSEQDWAIIRIDNRGYVLRYLDVERGLPIQVGQDVYMIGHPSGLPLKFHGLAQVMEKLGAHKFSSNLDSFKGNSGSPVFSAETNRVVGILNAGSRDFIYNARNDCYVSTYTTCVYGDCEEGSISTVASALDMVENLEHCN